MRYSILQVKPDQGFEVRELWDDRRYAQALKHGHASIAQFRNRYPAAMDCLERSPHCP